MARPDGVDVVALHRLKIMPYYILCHYPAVSASKLVTVYSTENDSLAVKPHNVVFTNLKLSEAHIFLDDLRQLSRGSIYFYRQFIKVRLFRTPQFRIVNCKRKR